MAGEINKLRIHFYGVQGSGAVYPREPERHEIRRRSEVALLQRVLHELQQETEHGGSRISAIEALLGGSVSAENIANYWLSLDLPEPPSYGGWTSCFRVETADGHDIVFDCGSGFRVCAQDLERKWAGSASRQLTIFGSHAHFDHTEGFDQADVCFNPANKIHVYGNASYLEALDHYIGVFSHQVPPNPGRQTPLTYKLMPAQFSATELRDLTAASGDVHTSVAQQVHDWNLPVRIGETSVQAFEVFHPDPCLAFRVEHADKVFVYCTDHELRHGDNDQHPLQQASVAAENTLAEMVHGADVVYRDGQFLRSEYDGEKAIGNGGKTSRRDWGHSCIEDVVAMALNSDVKRTYIGHHDPSRPWQERVEIDTMLEQHCSEEHHIELAKAETVIDL